jgi:hypothetical protein
MLLIFYKCKFLIHQWSNIFDVHPFSDEESDVFIQRSSINGVRQVAGRIVIVYFYFQNTDNIYEG